MFILGLSTMVWHMFIVKKLSSAAFLMDKVMFLIISVISFLVDIFGPPESTPKHLDWFSHFCRAHSVFNTQIGHGMSVTMGHVFCFV